MKPLQFSSGDLVADRRADYAEMLFSTGDRKAACDLLRDALGLVPDWAAGWFRLGEMLHEEGEIAAATDAWREALRLDPADRFGAALKLELCGVIDGQATLSSAFAETLFDQYADRFETELVEKLHYRVPEQIVAALEQAGRTRFAHAVDLGCGTGLMGERLRAMTSYLEGNDISEGMIAKARAKGVYDALDRRDLQNFSVAARVADLVTAADVFIYLGRLERIIDEIAAMLVPDGLVAFSIERHDGEGDLLLNEARRYAHAPAYVETVLAQAGFAIVSMDETAIRHDRGAPVAGLVILARRLAKTEALSEQASGHLAETLSGSRFGM